MGFFSVIEERIQVVNFTNYLGYDTYTILMKNIQRVSKVEGFTAPFTRKVSASLRPKPFFKLRPETVTETKNGHNFRPDTVTNRNHLIFQTIVMMHRKYVT